MTFATNRTLILYVAVLVFFVTTGVSAYYVVSSMARNNELIKRQQLAAEQVKFFEWFAMKKERRADVTVAVRLEQIERYYPSGSKQIPGTPLDQIVESARRIAVQCVKNETLSGVEMEVKSK